MSSSAWALLNAAFPSAAIESANADLEALEEQHGEIEQMVKGQPEVMAARCYGSAGPPAETAPPGSLERAYVS